MQAIHSIVSCVHFVMIAAQHADRVINVSPANREEFWERIKPNQIYVLQVRVVQANIQT
jgi:hypothetical protein